MKVSCGEKLKNVSHKTNNKAHHYISEETEFTSEFFGGFLYKRKFDFSIIKRETAFRCDFYFYHCEKSRGGCVGFLTRRKTRRALLRFH